MKKFIIYFFFLLNSLMFAQTTSGQIGDSVYISKSFFNAKDINSGNISTNDIWFGIFPLSDRSKISEFKANFKIPENVLIYDKIYLNGRKKTAGYNPIWAVGKNEIKKRSISFDYTKEISKSRNVFFWFHLVPLLNDTGKISVDYEYKLNNGDTFSGKLESGNIISHKPKLKGLIARVSDDELKLNFPLKYNFDYEYSIPDDAQYDLVIVGENGISKEFNSNSIAFEKDGINRNYNILRGTIDYKGTRWVVSNQKFTVPGVIQIGAPVITPTRKRELVQVKCIGEDDIDLAIGGRIISSNFKKYPSVLQLSLPLCRLNFSTCDFSFIPLSLNYKTRFDGIDFFDVRLGWILKDAVFKYFDVFFNLGIGTEINWIKKDRGGQYSVLETGFDFRVWNRVKVYSTLMLNSKIETKDRFLTGIYLGLKYTIPKFF